MICMHNKHVCSSHIHILSLNKNCFNKHLFSVLIFNKYIYLINRYQSKCQYLKKQTKIHWYAYTKNTYAVYAYIEVFRLKLFKSTLIQCISFSLIIYILVTDTIRKDNTKKNQRKLNDRHLPQTLIQCSRAYQSDKHLFSVLVLK